MRMFPIKSEYTESGYIFINIDRIIAVFTDPGETTAKIMTTDGSTIPVAATEEEIVTKHWFQNVGS